MLTIAEINVHWSAYTGWLRTGQSTRKQHTTSYLLGRELVEHNSRIESCNRAVRRSVSLRPISFILTMAINYDLTTTALIQNEYEHIRVVVSSPAGWRRSTWRHHDHLRLALPQRSATRAREYTRPTRHNFQANGKLTE